MENVKSVYMPIGQVVRVNNKKIKFLNWVCQNKIMLIISTIFMVLISLYGILISQFIHLLQILY